jgi:hypothetical protein
VIGFFARLYRVSDATGAFDPDVLIAFGTGTSESAALVDSFGGEAHD